MYKHQEIIEYIEFLRDCIPNAVEIFTKGNCTAFAIMLDVKFNGGTVYHNLSHASFEYQGKFYDVTGDIVKPEGSLPITEYGPWLIRGLMKNNYNK